MNVRTLANIALITATALLVLITEQWESFVTFVLPGWAVNWMISNERRLVREGFQFPQIRWQVKFIVFVLPVAFSLGLVALWFPNYAHALNAWAIYSIASFSVALLLVKLYERYLSIRRKALIAADRRR